MTDRPPITKLDDLRPDPDADATNAVDQHMQTVSHIARIMAAEFAALEKQGVSVMAAAIMVGQRYRMTS